MLDIVDIKCFFEDGGEWLRYKCYFESKTGTIYFECDIWFDAKYTNGYRLIENSDTWLLIDEGHINNRPFEPQVEVAGNDVKSAVEFLIRKILNKPQKQGANVNIQELETKLREVLSTYYHAT